MSGSALTTTGSDNSLLSDLTTNDNNGSGTPVTFARVGKLSAHNSPKPPTDPNSAPQPLQPLPRPATASSLRTSSTLTSKGLTRQASKLFLKEHVEHISEAETVVVYQLMAKHKIDRERAVRMYLEEHDERLYNPKAVYLFPGEEYSAQADSFDEEEERRQQDLFGRVEYNHKTKEDDSVSHSSASVVEQRLIGAKKDPDQEALEHALLLSAQEDEFGINMYDSLTPADELVLHEYMSQGFTREEGALIIYEEKFGKTKFTRNSSVIPAMPTLQPVHGNNSTVHTGTDRSGRSGLVYESEEEEDEEVLDLMRRGYTREQAFAVIENHREKARRAAATQHPTDPTHYDPHPREEQFNLSEREEREVQATMAQRGCSRRSAVDIVVLNRVSRASDVSRASSSSQNIYSTEYGTTRVTESSESAEVRKYIDRGYTREQALQLIRSRPQSTSSYNAGGDHSGSSYHQPGHARRPSFGSTNSGGNESALSNLTLEESEIMRYTNRGYTREQAREMVRREGNALRRVRVRSSLLILNEKISFCSSIFVSYVILFSSSLYLPLT